MRLTHTTIGIVVLWAMTLSGGSAVADPMVPVISGTLRDVYGAPARACVTAVDLEVSPFVQPARPVVQAEPDGSYEIVLPHHGRWRLVAADYLEWGPEPRCAGVNDGGSWRYNDASHTIDTATGQLAPVDFTLTYALGASMADAYGSQDELVAAQPGENVELFARLHETVADRASVVFTDVTSGTEITLARSGEAITYGFARYRDSTFTIPADRPAGSYDVSFRVVDPAGIVANSVTQTLIVDDVAPAIGDVYPADGSSVYPDLRVWTTVTDDRSGVEASRGRTRIYDVTDGPRQLVRSRAFEDSDGVLQSHEPFTLAANRSFEADVIVEDHAGNQATRTVAFSTVARGPQLFAHAPTGVIANRSPVIEIFYGQAVDPDGILFRAHRMGSRLQDSWITPNLDRDARRAWIQPGSLDPATLRLDGSVEYKAPLLDGSYEMTAHVTTLGRTHIEPYGWTFEVAG